MSLLTLCFSPFAVRIPSHVIVFKFKGNSISEVPDIKAAQLWARRTHSFCAAARTESWEGPAAVTAVTVTGAPVSLVTAWTMLPSLPWRRGLREHAGSLPPLRVQACSILSPKEPLPRRGCHQGHRQHMGGDLEGQRWEQGVVYWDRDPFNGSTPSKTGIVLARVLQRSRTNRTS